ncbi:MAG: ribosome biogenesis GTPase Der [Thermomicrobia bacterium]|nr:ribosome biogenesis GTPase Der [Thermomicrobia bacterium]MCA1725666.1 ribosome biogenesis GTPase Der [Thermomicrobia bacterium]
MAKPIVAVVGRPNVGKSTLFNRLIGERRAIVQDEPGTTRDRVYGDVEWNGVSFALIDTGGIIVDERGAELDLSTIPADTLKQAQHAIEEADVIVMVVDANIGTTTADHTVADIVRRTRKPVVLAANKAESNTRAANAVDFYALGLTDPIVVSSLHGRGTGDLLDAIVEALPERDEETDATGPRIAIVGRPNVGKSRLLNAFLGQERAIVSDEPGTTRDSLDTELIWEGETITLVDTAGIRRRGKIEPGIEKYSVLRSMRAITRADVVLLVVDATEGFTSQDLHIAGYVADEARGMVLVVNKWDLVEKDGQTMEQYRAAAAEALDFMPYVPAVFISAKFNQRVPQVMERALLVMEERLKRVPTAALNKMLRTAVEKHAPPSKPGKWVKFFYATQVDVSPPSFVFFCNHAEDVHFSYRRYLENQLREEFGFIGNPIRMRFRNRQEPAP